MEISIREFQHHANDYLTQLPIVLTRYNVPVAKVIPITVGELKVATPSSDISEDRSGDGVSGFKLCQAKWCNNYAVEGSDFCIEHGK